jgi:hypothetical protein
VLRVVEVGEPQKETYEKKQNGQNKEWGKRGGKWDRTGPRVDGQREEDDERKTSTLWGPGSGSLSDELQTRDNLSSWCSILT